MAKRRTKKKLLVERGWAVVHVDAEKFAVTNRRDQNGPDHVPCVMPTKRDASEWSCMWMCGDIRVVPVEIREVAGKKRK